MSKRTAADSELAEQALKSGQRPGTEDDGDAPEFEDEFEDEFESEDEIMEAGVDGRPDEEREAEEREGLSAAETMLRAIQWLIPCSYGRRSGDLHTRANKTASRRKPSPRPLDV